MKLLFSLTFNYFKGRSIIVDWAIPKNKYETIHTPKENQGNNVKEETAEKTENKQEDIKEEVLSDDQNSINEFSKTAEDYLTLDTLKNEDDNYIDFNTTNE